MRVSTPINYNLQSRLRYWQKTLRLLDWEIRAQWAPGQELDGSNKISEENKQSDILLDSSLKTKYFNADVTLVHELLHLPFEYSRETKEAGHDILLEQAIQQLARTLVSLDSGKRQGFFEE